MEQKPTADITTKRQWDYEDLTGLVILQRHRLMMMGNEFIGRASHSKGLIRMNVAQLLFTAPEFLPYITEYEGHGSQLPFSYCDDFASQV